MTKNTTTIRLKNQGAPFLAFFVRSGDVELNLSGKDFAIGAMQ
jgi:hypothetical protein